MDKEGEVGGRYTQVILVRIYDNFDQFISMIRFFILQLMRSDEPVKQVYCRNFLLFLNTSKFIMTTKLGQRILLKFSP